MKEKMIAIVNAIPLNSHINPWHYSHNREHDIPEAC